MKPLVCLYCGGTLFIDGEWRGHGHLSELAPSAIECDDCGATWSTVGEPLTEPIGTWW